MKSESVYRIYTENRQRDNIASLVAGKFESFTILEAQGYWKQIAEDSLIIEIATDDKAGVYYVAQLIKALNSQEAVLITQETRNIELV